MRTIDADKLCTDLMERWDIADKQKEELIRQVMADIVTPIVVSQPTIEPERKKGEWNRYYKMHTRDTFCCNRCGSCFIVIQGSEQMNYCPNCGADNS